MTKLRIDVDYPYPSRMRSFVYTAFGVELGNDYLKNSKIIAKMINESQKKVMAYWFFTPKTIPDEELLALLKKDRHEVALHIVNDPYKELALLERATGRKINYYTIHGTARFIARIMWRRWMTKAPRIPDGYPLQSFYQFPTLGLDVLCYDSEPEQAFQIASRHLEKGDVLHMHPIWLFQRGRLNHRGSYFQVLRRILDVEKEFETMVSRKKLFFTVASNAKDHETDIDPTDEFLELLGAKGTDIFTLLERGWCHIVPNPSRSWVKEREIFALLEVASYDEWLASVGKKTRNMIRKAGKNGITTRIAEPDERLAEGIWKIYNETPIRQERGFPHYGESLRQVTTQLHSTQNCTYIGAYFQNELAGFIQLVHGENIEIISQILSLQKHWDKAINNALVAKAVAVCANKGSKWIMYGRMGNHPSLDDFKQSNGFVQFPLTRYYIPLTRKGKIAIKLGLHRDPKDSLPRAIKYQLFEFYNWISRTRIKIKLRLGQKRAIR